MRELVLVALLGLSSAAHARARKQAGADPSRWFASRAGLTRLYQARGAKDAVPAGANCEVLESSPSRTRERCTMIVARLPKGSTELTYEKRARGIYLVKADARDVEQLKLPAPIARGQQWNEKRGTTVITRRVRVAGKTCKAAGRSFGDCLVLDVTERSGRKVKRRSTETYAAGVGLVEDAQWELVDVQGL